MLKPSTIGTKDMIKNKHINITKLIATSKPGSTLDEAIFEAIATACDNNINVSLVHNNSIFEIDPHELLMIVDKTRKVPK